MEKIKPRKLPPRNTRINTSAQSLTEEVWLYLSRRLPFGRVARAVKDVGEEKMREILSEMKHSEPQNKVGLFIWKVTHSKKKT